MGKGDRKTKKGKRSRKSYGKTRSSKSNLNKKLKIENEQTEEFRNKMESLRLLCNQYEVFRLLESEYEKRIINAPDDKNLLESKEKLGEDKIKTLELLDNIRENFYPYSIEEIFANNGQYDRFVSLEFYPDSNAFKRFGESIMGVFVFTQYERKFLKRHLGQSKYPRTSNKLRFEPSELCSLDDSQIEELKAKGIDNRDIKVIYQTNMPYENRYKKRPEYKEIPNTIGIKVRDNGYDYGLAILQMYESRIRNSNYPLIPEEYHEYLSLKLQYKPDDLSAEEKSEIYKSDGATMKPSVADFYIKRKFFRVKMLNEDDTKLFNEYIKRKTDKAKKSVDKEVSKSSSESFLKIITKDLPSYRDALILASQFEPENLSTYGAKHSVRLGLSGFLHIFLRHCKGYQFGDWKGKRTTFEYKTKDVIQVIKIIIENLQKDIDKALDGGNDFQLNIGTSYLYDGNYYAIHIDKNGNLLSLNPRNK